MEKIPAGKYYIGDPCYVIAEEKWMDFLNKGFWPAEEKGRAVFEFEGKTCFAHHTAYGDGVYFDNKGEQFPVDAGIIGAIPFELCDRVYAGEVEARHLGIIVDLENETSVEYDEGTFHIGDREIPTNFGDEEEDEDDAEDEDDQ